MSRSVDPGHFFQTDASDATRARRAAKADNKNGSPIRLQSKILDVIADPFSIACVYIAESVGCIRKVNIESKDTTTVYRGPTAPLTSVAIGGAHGSTIFAGCWDKDVWSWDSDSKALNRSYKGHSDFVKTVTCAKISGKYFLISGGADSKIMVWDTATGNRIHTLRDASDSMRAVQYLAIDPVDTGIDEAILVSSSSDPQIRRWRISSSSACQIMDKKSNSELTASYDPTEAIIEHETSVYRLFFDSDEGDLWTASADGTAKCLSRAHGWASEETIEHGDYVRAVAVTTDWIITAGRDENVKIWDRTTAKLFHIYEGHYQEVTGLVVMNDGREVVSVSIDGTVRLWPLDKAQLEKARSGEKNKAMELQKEDLTAKNLLTEEEEAELAELMDD